MRKALIGALLTATTLFSVPALAEGTEKKIGIGGDALFVLPVGDLSDATGPQLGILGRFGYRVIPQLEVTGRIGYIHGFKKTIVSAPGAEVKEGVSDIPIWAGARYFFFPDIGFYAAAEIGFNFLTASVDPGDSASKTRFGFNAGAGYVISPELPLDFRAQFINYNLLGKDSATVGNAEFSESSFWGFGISVGYTYL